MRISCLQSLHGFELDGFPPDVDVGVNTDWMDAACCKMLVGWAFKEMNGGFHCL